MFIPKYSITAVPVVLNIVGKHVVPGNRGEYLPVTGEFKFNIISSRYRSILLWTVAKIGIH